MLSLGGVAAEELASRFGTPLYVYEATSIDERFRLFADAFAAANPLIAYSVKANGNLALLRRLAALGCGADVTSGGELHRALRAGIPAERIVFAGVGKTTAEIRSGIKAGILSFNVESAGELERIDALASAARKRVGFGVRVNPDVEARTPHEYTRTGRAADKFGVPWEEVESLLEWSAGRRAVRPLGLAMHIGSQVTQVGPYVRAVDRVLGLVDRVRGLGIGLSYMDVGGGFGIRYGDEEPLNVAELAARLVPPVREAGLRLIVEPGRAIVGEAGTLLTRVEYVKGSGSKTFVIVDGGMSELIRPSHYDGYHEIEIATVGSERGAGQAGRNGPGDGAGGTPRDLAPGPVEVDVVGPICETGDFLARGRTMNFLPAPGALLAVRTVGAYGFSMSSNYNGRPRPAEVVVEGGKATLVRRRETIEDLWRGEE